MLHVDFSALITPVLLHHSPDCLGSLKKSTKFCRIMGLVERIISYYNLQLSPVSNMRMQIYTCVSIVTEEKFPEGGLRFGGFGLFVVR